MRCEIPWERRYQQPGSGGNGVRREAARVGERGSCRGAVRDETSTRGSHARAAPDTTPTRGAGGAGVRSPSLHGAATALRSGTELPPEHAVHLRAAGSGSRGRGARPWWSRSDPRANCLAEAGAEPASTGRRRPPVAAVDVPRVDMRVGHAARAFHGWKPRAGGAGHDFHSPGAGQAELSGIIPGECIARKCNRGRAPREPRLLLHERAIARLIASPLLGQGEELPLSQPSGRDTESASDDAQA